MNTITNRDPVIAKKMRMVGTIAVRTHSTSATTRSPTRGSAHQAKVSQNRREEAPRGGQSCVWSPDARRKWRCGYKLVHLGADLGTLWFAMCMAETVNLLY